MLHLEIPGFKVLDLEHLVLDFNGTLAADGELLPGVSERLKALAAELQIHILTADTFGRAAEAVQGLPVSLRILGLARQDEAKLACVEDLGAGQVVCIGNGRNDRRMLRAAALGIAVSGREGLATEAFLAAQLVTPNVQDALDLLKRPQRLVATLRS
jgi:soluble P-type ATPase